MLSPSAADALLRKGLKISHLRLLAALAETGQLTQAAALVGVSQPAASRLVAEVERIIGHPVHQRSGRGIEMTPLGRALAQRAQRIRIELDDAARDMAEIAAGGVGHVRVGTVTGAALDRVLPALHAQQQAHPKVTFEVVVAASDALCDQVLAGRLDFAVGRMPVGLQAGALSYDALDREPVDLIVRLGHPLLQGGTVPDLLRHDWVMPGADSLLTRTVLARLQALGLPKPPLRIATASFMLTLALLQRSDAVAAVSRSIARQFAGGHGMGLAILPQDLGIVVDPYGMISRQQVSLTPAARRLADHITMGLGTR
jgi:DNA-binding transcriptional LysR family regulator